MKRLVLALVFAFEDVLLLRPHTNRMLHGDATYLSGRNKRVHRTKHSSSRCGSLEILSTHCLTASHRWPSLAWGTGIDLDWTYDKVGWLVKPESSSTHSFCVNSKS